MLCFVMRYSLSVSGHHAPKTREAVVAAQGQTCRCGLPPHQCPSVLCSFNNTDQLQHYRVRPHLHGSANANGPNSLSKKSSVHTHSAHLTCPFTRDHWKRCSTYAGPVIDAVLLPQNTPKAVKKTPEHGCHGCPSVYALR